MKPGGTRPAISSPAGPGHPHSTVAEQREGCVCALLVRDPPVYTTWAGKLLAPFIQI